MEGSDPRQKLRGAYVEALKKNWMLWPAVQAVNFKFVPLEHRVLLVNVVSLGEWGLPSSFLCCLGVISGGNGEVSVGTRWNGGSGEEGRGLGAEMVS